MVATAPTPTASASDATSRIRQLASIADELQLGSIAADAERLAQRIADGLFYVACVGQFKRGKSSLLNALVPGAALPTGVVPVTSAITVVRHGIRRHAIIHLPGGETREIPLDELSAWVTERENPGNAKGVVAAEIFVPSGLLASGMCLVDTPGLGSVSTDNTAITRAFVPHLDAALVVLGTDPPISADELALVDDAARQGAELIVVLGKADRSPDVERQEARAFCASVLEARLGRPVGPVFEVSAAERLAGNGPPRDWPQLLSRMETLAVRAGAHLVDAAAERGLRLLGAQALREIDERVDALTRPLAASERRIEALKRSAARAERSLGDLGHLLNAEQERLHGLFTDRQEDFRARVLPGARAELARALETCAASSRSRRWREAHRAAQDIFRRLLDAWRAQEQPHAEQLYREAVQRFIDLANGFLTRVAAEGALPSAELPPVFAAERGFRARSRLYFTELMYRTTRPPLRWLADALRSPASFAHALARDAGEYLEQLLVTNASRVTSDLDEQVLESRRRLERDLRERLRDVYRVAERALERAQERVRSGATAIREETERLAAARQAIERVLATPEVAA